MYYKPASLTEISISLRNNTLDLKQYISNTCKRIELIEGTIHSLIPEKDREKRLLKEADVLLKKYSEPSKRPPLFGVLVGIKDVFRVEGMPTRAGSKLPVKVFAGTESAVVTRLKDAGALILGKTVSTEFAYFTPGPTHNPRNPDYTPGGSSSGSAAAVASGLCPLAIGTQTIASIIRPAAYCGIVGFKPSYGRINAENIIHLSPTLDTVGFFTQEISGAAIAASVLLDNWDSTARSSSRPKLGLPSDAFLVQANCNSYNRFYKKVDTLTDAGYEIISFPLFKEIKNINSILRELLAAEFALNHKAIYKEYGELYSIASKELFEQGKKVSKAALTANKAIQETLRLSVAETMKQEGIDIWICPSTTSSAPRGIESTGSPLMSLPWTFLGMPIITIPAGKSSHDMPLGMQIIAGYGKDEVLLQYAVELYKLISY